MNCSICKKPIEVQSNGWEGGHNAFPLTDGKCCTICNDNEVIPMRMAFIASDRSMPSEALTSIVKEQQKARAVADVSLKQIAKEVNKKEGVKKMTIYRLAMDFKSKESMKKFIDELVAQGDLGDVAIYPMVALHEKNKTEKYIVRGYEAGNGINPL